MSIAFHLPEWAIIALGTVGIIVGGLLFVWFALKLIAHDLTPNP